MNGIKLFVMGVKEMNEKFSIYKNAATAFALAPTCITLHLSALKSNMANSPFSARTNTERSEAQILVLGSTNRTPGGNFDFTAFQPCSLGSYMYLLSTKQDSTNTNNITLMKTSFLAA
jgi:hypothetical protein